MSQTIARAPASRAPVSAQTGVACTLPAAPGRRPFFPRSFSCARSVLGLERIFEDEVSVCIWRRPPDPDLAKYLSECAFTEPLELVERVDGAAVSLEAVLRHFPASPIRARFAEDIRALVDLFATLAAAARIGLRLCVTRAPMCPRFHVDYASLRLLSTWVGPGTEWLEHDDVDRRFLGLGGGHAPDEASGLLLPGAQIHRMQAFEVALMKGERFASQEGRGVVHRSPRTTAAAPWRVMISLDDLD